MTNISFILSEKINPVILEILEVIQSQKEQMPDGRWRHSSIVLRPDTTLPGYEAIVLSEEQSEDLRVIAELIAVLG